MQSQAAMTNQAPDERWSDERIAALSTPEIVNLRHNAAVRGALTVVERCDAALARRTKTSRRAATARGPAFVMEIPDETVDDISRSVVALPAARDVPFAQQRIARLAAPVTQFSALWRKFLVCGFSSQEQSDPGTPLALFAVSASPLLDLAAVLAYGADDAWVLDQLRLAGLRRMADKKRALVASARAAFDEAKGESDELVRAREPGKRLALFISLASGRLHDRDLAQSAAFSATIDPVPLYGIGHKQVRNILVNSGLACNVVPLDSRWKAFFGKRVAFTSADLGRRERYLVIEHVLRRALSRVQTGRTDIPNLAVLDALVFASQSPRGCAAEGEAARWDDDLPGYDQARALLTDLSEGRGQQGSE